MVSAMGAMVAVIVNRWFVVSNWARSSADAIGCHKRQNRGMAKHKTGGPFAGDAVSVAAGCVSDSRDTAGGADNGAAKGDGQESVFQGRLA